jgi:hypothetical protein
VGGLQQLLGGMRRALHAHRHRSVCPSRPQKDRHATAGTAATLRVRTGGVRVAHAVTPPHNDSAPAADDTDTFATLAGKGAVHAPPGHPQSSRYTARCPFIVLCTPCSGVEWGVIEPALSVWGRGSGTTGKQPANLAVESTEESLSILPDYTPTVRPPPKRC